MGSQEEYDPAPKKPIDDHNGPVSLHQFKTLDQLSRYYLTVKTMCNETKNNYGWCGPNFVRSKTALPKLPGIFKK